MASFDFFSQPQGPQIDVDLFGRATSAGISAGNALPTQTTAILQGAQKGISQGLAWLQDMQQLRKGELDVAIKQNQIEMIPVANEAAKLKLEEDKLELNKKKTLAQESIEADQSKLSAEKAQYDALNAMNEAFKSGDPNQIATVMNNPSTIINLPADKWRNFMIASQGIPGISPELRNSISLIGNRAQKLSAEQKGIDDTLRANAKGYSSFLGEANNIASSVRGFIPNATSNEILDRTEAVDPGTVRVKDSASNRFIVDPSTGSYERVPDEENPYINDPTKAGSKQIIIWDSDRKGGRLLTPVHKTSDDYFKTYQSAQSYWNAASGKMHKNAVAAADRETANSINANQQASQSSVYARVKALKVDKTVANEKLKATQSSVSSGTTNATPLPDIYTNGIAKTEIASKYIPETALPSITPNLNNLQQIADKSVNSNWFNRGSIDSSAQKEIQTLVQKLSVDMYEKSSEEEKKLEYSKESLDKYNRDLYDSILTTIDKDPRYLNMPMDVKKRIVDSLYAPRAVNSPAALYQAKHGLAIGQDIYDTYQQYVSKIRSDTGLAKYQALKKKMAGVE